MSEFQYESPDFRDYIREQLARHSQPFTNSGSKDMPNQGLPEIMPTTEPSRTETEPPLDYKPTAVSDRATINQPTELMTQPLEPARQPLFYDPETDDDITREIPLGTIKVNPYVISDFDNTFSSTEKQKGEKKHSPLLIPVALIGLALTGGGVAVNELILKKIQDGPIVFIKREFTPPAHKQSPTPQQPEKVSAASHHISPSPHKVIHIVKKVKNEASAKATDAVNHPTATHKSAAPQTTTSIAKQAKQPSPISKKTETSKTATTASTTSTTEAQNNGGAAIAPPANTGGAPLIGNTAPSSKKSTVSSNSRQSHSASSSETNASNSSSTGGASFYSSN